MTPREVLLERACTALAMLVRDEYPRDCTLAEIADTWSYASDEQIEAIRILEDGDLLGRVP